VIIDTVDNAYRMCAEHVCQKFKIEHESDLGYGKGYALINNEFYRVLNKLSLLPYGLFLVSHSQEKEIETRTGKLTRIVPTLPDKARKIVLGMVDIILFGTWTWPPARTQALQRRVIRTKPHVNYEAGDRHRAAARRHRPRLLQVPAGFAGQKPAPEPPVAHPRCSPAAEQKSRPRPRRRHPVRSPARNRRAVAPDQKSCT
jgi:hypothetical protein